MEFEKETDESKKKLYSRIDEFIVKALENTRDIEGIDPELMSRLAIYRSAVSLVFGSSLDDFEIKITDEFRDQYHPLLSELPKMNNAALLLKAEDPSVSWPIIHDVIDRFFEIAMAKGKINQDSLNYSEIKKWFIDGPDASRNESGKKYMIEYLKSELGKRELLISEGKINVKDNPGDFFKTLGYIADNSRDPDLAYTFIAEQLSQIPERLLEESKSEVDSTSSLNSAVEPESNATEAPPSPRLDNISQENNSIGRQQK